MNTFQVTLLILNTETPILVRVQAKNAIQACDVAQIQNPGTIASGADLVPRT